MFIVNVLTRTHTHAHTISGLFYTNLDSEGRTIYFKFSFDR